MLMCTVYVCAGVCVMKGGSVEIICSHWIFISAIATHLGCSVLCSGNVLSN